MIFFVIFMFVLLLNFRNVQTTKLMLLIEIVGLQIVLSSSATLKT